MEELKIGSHTLRSRLIVGTGKYKDLEQTRAALEASGADMVTVAVRRLDLNAKGGDSLIGYLKQAGYTLLPNTAGCYTVDDAVRTCRLARELGIAGLVKVEVLGDPRTLFPDVVQTLEASRILVRKALLSCPTPTMIRSLR
jgi:thiazole synthase